MLSDEEKEKLEQEFQYALDNIVSKIKGETATAIVYSEQSMILLFRKLMFKIEKQSKEIEELNKSDASKEQSSMNYYNLYKELVDKIKAKIDEVDKDENASIPDFIEYAKEYATQKLQSLLEKE